MDRSGCQHLELAFDNVWMNISFMKRNNSIDPRTYPCGTSLVIIELYLT